MIGITATMLLALAFSITDAHSFNNKKTIPQDSFSAYHGAKLPELEYYENYEELRSTSNTVVIYPIFTQSAYELDGIHSFTHTLAILALLLKFKIFMKNFMPQVEMVLES